MNPTLAPPREGVGTVGDPLNRYRSLVRRPGAGRAGTADGDVRQSKASPRRLLPSMMRPWRSRPKMRSTIRSGQTMEMPSWPPKTRSPSGEATMMSMSDANSSSMRRRSGSTTRPMPPATIRCGGGRDAGRHSRACTPRDMADPGGAAVGILEGDDQPLAGDAARARRHRQGRGPGGGTALADGRGERHGAISREGGRRGKRFGGGLSAAQGAFSLLPSPTGEGGRRSLTDEGATGKGAMIPLCRPHP